MTCPACGNQLSEFKIGSITVDACDGGCGGIWFDNLELMKVDEPNESAGEALIALARRKDLEIDEQASRACPRCKDMVLFRHFHSVKRRVQIDECSRCGGVWLDVGELAFIRNQFNSEPERRQAAEAYFSDVFGAELEQMRQAGKESQEKARQIAQVLRFVCPSYYLPGKQGGGAF